MPNSSNPERRRSGWPWPESAQRIEHHRKKDPAATDVLQAEMTALAADVLALVDELEAAVTRLDDIRGELALAADAASLKASMWAIERARRAVG